jgi:hypothetical protein
MAMAQGKRGNTVKKRMTLRRVRWLVKAGEFPPSVCPIVLEAVLDMLADGMPGLLGACTLQLEEVPGGVGEEIPAGGG